MKPSPHFVRYDAQTYAEHGFLEVSGRVRDMAQKPRHWQITATARTQNPDTGETRPVLVDGKPVVAPPTVQNLS